MKCTEPYLMSFLIPAYAQISLLHFHIQYCLCSKFSSRCSCVFVLNTATGGYLVPKKTVTQ